MHAAEDLVQILLIGLAVLARLAVAAGIGLIAWHKRRTPPEWTAQVQSPPRAPQRTVQSMQRAVQSRTAARSALLPQIHLHLHGPVSAADVAELIACQGNPQPAAIEED